MAELVDDERRRAPRRIGATSSRLFVSTTYPVRIIDISQDGLLLSLPQMLPCGSGGELRAMLGNEPFRARLEVMRAHEGKGECRIGTRFVALDRAGRAVLERVRRRG
jgi:hypothetical protein